MISEAKYPFMADLTVATHRQFWDLMTESFIRVMTFLTTSFELAPMILGVAGAALNLFRRGVRSFEIGLVLHRQLSLIVTVNLAIGAWPGFVAGYLLRYLSEELAGQSLRNFVVTVGCIAAGYSSWFVEGAINKLWSRLELSKPPG